MDIYKWNEEWITLFTNHQIKQLKNKHIKEIHSNHCAKILLWHIETYQKVLHSLLKEKWPTFEQ